MKNFSTNVKSFIIGASLVPLGGLLAHMGSSVFTDNCQTNPSLSDRFETAYCLNTPESHKYYNIQWDSTYGGGTEKSPYWAHPFATYPAMLALGLLAARKRWYPELKKTIKENCR